MLWKKNKKSNQVKNNQVSIFSRKFFLKKNFDRWLEQNRDEAFRLLIHEIMENPASIYDEIVVYSVRLRQEISRIGDRLALDMLRFPTLLRHVDEFEDRFIDTIKGQGEKIKELGESARELQNIIGNINEFVVKVSELSDSTHNQATHMRETTRKARESIEISLASSEEITDRNKVLQDEIGKLREVIGKVKDQVSLINKISDQTNMLALNASIEAARAGELGRGFSVVAEGVSRLADQSRTALEEINQVIDQMSRTFENWESISSDQISKMDEIIQYLKNISNMIKENDNVSSDTLKHMGEAKSVVASMNNHIQNLDDRTRFVSRTALGISMKTENLSVWSSNIKKDINDILGIIVDSTSLISSDNPIWLLDFLRFRRQDHVNWVKKAFEALDKRDPEGFPEMDPTKCKLGLWYHQVDLKDDIQKMIHDELDEPHKLLHDSARRIREAILENSEERLKEEIKNLENQYSRIADILDRYEDYLEQKVIDSK